MASGPRVHWNKTERQRIAEHFNYTKNFSASMDEAQLLADIPSARIRKIIGPSEVPWLNAYLQALGKPIFVNGQKGRRSRFPATFSSPSVRPDPTPIVVEEVAPPAAKVKIAPPVEPSPPVALLSPGEQLITDLTSAFTSYIDRVVEERVAAALKRAAEESRKEAEVEDEPPPVVAEPVRPSPPPSSIMTDGIRRAMAVASMARPPGAKPIEPTVHLPRILVVGPTPKQASSILSAFPQAKKLRIIHASDMNRRHIEGDFEQIFIMTNYVNISLQHKIKEQWQTAKIHYIQGGSGLALDALRVKLTTVFPAKKYS